MLASNVQASRVHEYVNAAVGSAFVVTCCVIWLDPPYPFTNEQVSHTLSLAMERLVHNGIIVLERSARTGEPDFPEGTEHWSKGYGETVLHFCPRTDPANTQEN